MVPDNRGYKTEKYKTRLIVFCSFYNDVESRDWKNKLKLNLRAIYWCSYTLDGSIEMSCAEISQGLRAACVNKYNNRVHFQTYCLWFRTSVTENGHRFAQCGFNIFRREKLTLSRRHWRQPSDFFDRQQRRTINFARFNSLVERDKNGNLNLNENKELNGILCLQNFTEIYTLHCG